MDRLYRTRMLVGNDAVQKFQRATIMIVGCGAVGSFAIEALARCGIGHLILVDFDNFVESNINRQLFALDSTVGQAKVDVAKKRILDINPDISVHTINTKWTAETDVSVKPDYVIDAIDDLNAKIALVAWCQKNKIPVISSMGAGRKINPEQIKISKLSKTNVCPLASRMRALARKAGLDDLDVVYSTEPAVSGTVQGREFGSVITVTGTFGLRIAGWVINKIIEK